MLQEQFRTPEQQRETATIGMWIFLITEVMLFGGLFVSFAIYRLSYAEAFLEGTTHMNVVLGSINTAVLICSSFTMALAVHSAESGNRRLISLFLAGTMVLGAVFLSIKFTEYYMHYHHHKVPWVNFEFTGNHAAQAGMFFLLYFVMTGLHALHMLVGEGLLAFVLWRNRADSFSAEYHTPVEMVGLYWHFVDVIWVFLFALFYVDGLYLHH